VTHPRPSFIRTAGERALDSQQDVDRWTERYRGLMAAVFTWEGLPEDAPGDFLERCLFDVGGVGILETGGVLGQIVAAGRAVSRDHYDRGAGWTPVFPAGYIDKAGLLPQSSDSPILLLPSMRERITPYLEVYDAAMKAMRQNAISMSQPILLEGAVENRVEGQLLEWELATGKITVPSLASRGVPYKVLDLGVHDWTSALQAVMDAMDREILTIMGIRNAGTEKASGITPEETLSISQQMVLWIEGQLQAREDWAERASAFHGLDISVRLSDLYTASSDGWMTDMQTDLRPEEAEDVRDQGA